MSGLKTIPLLLLLFIINSYGQIQPSTYNRTHNYVHEIQPNNSRALTCEDVVQYAQGKATIVRGLNINIATSADKIGQWYPVPQPMQINGFTFYAWQNDGTSTIITLNCNLYLAGPDSLPIGGALASAVVTVDTTFGTGDLTEIEKIVTFPLPVNINSPYVLSVETQSSINIAVVTNDWDSIDGGQEWLGMASVPGSGWLHGYDLNVGGIVFDADVLLEPRITYQIDAGLTADVNCLPNGGDVIFTNISTGSIAHSRFYNVLVESNLDSLIYQWNFGDASPILNSFHAVHNFVPGFDYQTLMSFNVLGWTSACIDTAGELINPSTQSSFSYSINEQTVSFTNESFGGIERLWDFGTSGMSDTSSQKDPVFIYDSIGVYQVCLITEGQCFQDTFCAQIILCESLTNDFSASNSGLEFQFTDLSSGGDTVLWSFGDGVNK